MYIKNTCLNVYTYLGTLSPSAYAALGHCCCMSHSVKTLPQYVLAAPKHQTTETVTLGFNVSPAV